MSARCPRQSGLAFTCPNPQDTGVMRVDRGATYLNTFLVLAALVSTTYFVGNYVAGIMSPSRKKSALPSELWKEGQEVADDVTSEESRVFNPPRHRYSSLDSASDL
jgi:hypothetical protein